MSCITKVVYLIVLLLRNPFLFFSMKIIALLLRNPLVIFPMKIDADIHFGSMKLNGNQKVTLVNKFQVAELIAFMAKNRDSSYCKVVEVIAETTAPLTPMGELLAKIPSHRADLPPKVLFFFLPHKRRKKFIHEHLTCIKKLESKTSGLVHL